MDRTLTRTDVFEQFLSVWLNENINYHHDWCWTKSTVYKDGEDIKGELFELLLVKMFGGEE